MAAIHKAQQRRQGERSIGSMSKTRILNVRHVFFVNFFAGFTQLRREMTKF